MNNVYTEFEILEISKTQYSMYFLGEDFTILNNKKIGYISEINNKLSGENSYVITDSQLPDNPTPEDLAKVKHVLVH